MNPRPFALLLVFSLVWTLGGAGELFAAGPGTTPNKEFSDVPSTETWVLVGAIAALVITVVVVLIVNSGDDEEAGETQEITVSGIGKPASPERIDPVLILGRGTMGAGLAFSF